jgi:ketosteroid isomerase-like protein
MAKWTLNGTSPEGGPVEIAGQTSDVLRRQSDGNWLIVIDNPFGAQSA